MIRPILRYGDSTLHEPARAVTDITAEIDGLVKDMIETMYAAPGVGLAAPQVGAPLRLFVIDVSVGRDRSGLIVLLNPQFVERDGMQLEEEGCLSLPGFNATVARPGHAVVKGLDLVRDRTSRRGRGSARQGVPARDGPPGRARLRRPAPGNQARPHRAPHPQADAARKVVGATVTRRISRVLFFGTPDFAVPTLEGLLESRYEVAGVVTQPDRPRGRGQRVSEGPVKRLAVSRGIPVLQPDRLRDQPTLDAIGTLGADVAVVAAYGKILPDALLAAVPWGFINVHASLLPRYRGAAPIQRAVMAGEPLTGVSIMEIVRELDAGPVYATTESPIGPDDTADWVERRLAVDGAALLLTVLDGLADGSAAAVAQDHSLATYAPRITRDDGLLDWTRPADSLHNQVRGLHPWPHAFTFLGQLRLIILRTRVEVPAERLPADPGLELPGAIVRAEGDCLAVAAGDGASGRDSDDPARGAQADERAGVPRGTPGPRRATPEHPLNGRGTWDSRLPGAPPSPLLGRSSRAPICRTRSPARAIRLPTGATAPSPATS